MTQEPAVEPLVRVMALHALAYCERLFYLEEVEEIRIADEAVYAGRRLHEELTADEGSLVSLTLESERLGVKGRVDCLRTREGRLIPYEHKRGRSTRADGKPAAWPTDRLQVSAYAMLLEEHTGRPIDEARVRYHADNATVHVPVDDEARQDVARAVARAQSLRSSRDRPPVSPNDRLCLRCSLAPVCLPEEERLARDPGWEPVRLFPPDLERQTVHVIDHGARVTRSGDSLVIVRTDGQQESFPVRDIGQLVLHGYSQITTQALHLCAHDMRVISVIDGDVITESDGARVNAVAGREPATACGRCRSVDSTLPTDLGHRRAMPTPSTGPAAARLFPENGEARARGTAGQGDSRFRFRATAPSFRIGKRSPSVARAETKVKAMADRGGGQAPEQSAIDFVASRGFETRSGADHALAQEFSRTSCIVTTE